MPESNLPEVQVVQQKPSNLNYSREFSSNVMAGLGVSGLTFPAESLKKLHQNTGVSLTQLFKEEKTKLNLSSSKMLRQIFKTGNLNAYRFYRGFSIFAINIVPTTTVQLSTKALLDDSLNSDSRATKMAINVGSGVAGAFTATAVENTIVRQQELKAGPAIALKDMINHRGIFGPWKSLPLIMARDGIFTLWMLGLNPKIKDYVAHHVEPSYMTFASWSASITLGTLGAILSHPFDTMATRMQATHQPVNIVGAFKEAAKLENHVFTGLFKRIILFNAFVNLIPYFKKMAEKGYDHATKETPPPVIPEKKGLPSPPDLDGKSNKAVLSVAAPSYPRTFLFQYVPPAQSLLPPPPLNHTHIPSHH